MELAGIVCTLSQEITLAISRPFVGPTGTSVGNPLALDVIGATVTCVMAPRTPARVKMTTGRDLSRRAIWIGRKRV